MAGLIMVDTGGLAAKEKATWKASRDAVRSASRTTRLAAAAGIPSRIVSRPPVRPVRRAACRFLGYGEPEFSTPIKHVKGVSVQHRSALTHAPSLRLAPARPHPHPHAPHSHPTACAAASSASHRATAAPASTPRGRRRPGSLPRRPRKKGSPPPQAPPGIPTKPPPPRSRARPRAAASWPRCAAPLPPLLFPYQLSEPALDRPPSARPPPAWWWPLRAARRWRSELRPPPSARADAGSADPTEVADSWSGNRSRRPPPARARRHSTLLRRAAEGEHIAERGRI